MNLPTPASSLIVCEVCIDSVAGAKTAEQAGADRVELCANLVEGGTTPSAGMIRSVLAATALPVMVMVRPRGGHFCYDDTERSVMLREAEAVIDQHVAGIVVGALDRNGAIDRSLCRELRQLAAGRSLTFHRAFDQVVDPGTALETLIDLGFDRILTSGLAGSALLGLERLAALVDKADARIGIMPGCGIRADNVRQIVAQTGAREIHFSGSVLVEDPLVCWRTDVPMSAPTTPGDLRRRVVSAAEVQAICAAVGKRVAMDEARPS